jgi:hypothetical protein
MFLLVSAAVRPQDVAVVNPPVENVPPCVTTYISEQPMSCADDERKVTDPRGGFKCIKRTKKMIVEYNAADCLKEFKANSETKLVVPLDEDGNPNFDKAHLEGFTFKFVCPVPKKDTEEEQ